MFSFLENQVLRCILTLKFPEVIQILPIISIHLLININSIILLTKKDFKKFGKRCFFSDPHSHWISVSIPTHLKDKILISILTEGGIIGIP